MSEHLYLLAPLALVLAVALVLWRIWPVLMGRVRSGESSEDRLARWNKYLYPLFHKTLEDKLHVARAGFVGPEGQQRTITTWTLEPSMLPDVEFIAVARPGTADEPDIQAVGEAEVLRGLLSGYVQEQTMWGHTAYIHVWPPDADIDAVVAQLMPVEVFRERYAGSPDPEPVEAST